MSVPSPAAGAGAPAPEALRRVDDGWELDLADPEPDLAADAITDRLAAAARAVAAQGGGRLHVWVRGEGADAVRTSVEAAGFEVVRALHQMRRPLPVDEPWDLDVRPFVVGQDEDAWIEVNNRAFAWHPEQAGMTRERLAATMAEPWFDPAGFLLHEVDGRLAGFCWTKVHADTDPPLGEIFVIAVDPAAHRRGLGRQLVLAGLDHLHRRDLRVGMLYTEADNLPALRLYEDLGFHVHATDRRYAKEVPAA